MGGGGGIAWMSPPDLTSLAARTDRMADQPSRGSPVIAADLAEGQAGGATARAPRRSGDPVRTSALAPPSPSLQRATVPCVRKKRKLWIRLRDLLQFRVLPQTVRVVPPVRGCPEAESE